MTKAYAFKKGWMQVQNKDLQACRRDLKEALGVSTDVAFQVRMRGEVEPKISQYKAVEAVFAKYGITDVWGDDKSANS